LITIEHEEPMMMSLRTYGWLERIGVTEVATHRKLRARLTRPLIASVTIDRPPYEIYACYRRLQRQLTSYIEAADALELRPADVGIVDDRPGELLSWRSKTGDGRVTLTRVAGTDTTELKIELEVGPLSRLFVGRKIRGDLQRWKQAMMTGFGDGQSHQCASSRARDIFAAAASSP
jgi:uncharacterized membrane protein